MRVIEGSETTCIRCGRRIVLVRKIVAGKYVLAARPQRYEWKCEPTRELPLRTHIPALLPGELRNGDTNAQT